MQEEDFPIGSSDPGAAPSSAPTRDETDEVVSLIRQTSYLHLALETTFGPSLSSGAVRKWLRTPNEVLDGKTPARSIKENEIQAVIRALGDYKPPPT